LNNRFALRRWPKEIVVVEVAEEVVVVVEQPTSEREDVEVAVVGDRRQDPVSQKKSWISPSERLLMVRKA
jgi:hypothetical protein